MKALLVRVAADQTPVGGRWNSPVDSHTNEFVYVPISESDPCHPDLATSYAHLDLPLEKRWPGLPNRLANCNAHMDPDFSHLTYGDCGERAKQIESKLRAGDLLVFYGGLKDVHSSPRPRLVYALIGLYVIDDIVRATSVSESRWGENAHTRRVLTSGSNDIVVTAKPDLSGRLERCIPIGEYREDAYRVCPPLLAAWGGLSVKNGYLQRSARLPEFLDADKFYRWFLAQGVSLIPRNNWDVDPIRGS